MDKAKLYNADGSPRFIRCYETKRNPTADRFTVAFTRANVWGGKEYEGRVYYVGMSGNPFSPAGFCQHGEAARQEFCPRGSRIAFVDLPDDCQKAARAEYRDLWEAGHGA
jgi:hypothetical protein